MTVEKRIESFQHSYREMLRGLVLRGLSMKHDSAYTDVLVEDEIDTLEAKLNPLQGGSDTLELFGLPVCFVGAN